MSDDHKKNYRTAPGDIAEDDPLAELARIIGYDRPKEARPQVDAPQTVPELDVFDLEAELMRELDQTQFDEPQDEPDEAPQFAPASEADADISDEYLGEDIAEQIAQADVAAEPEAEDLESDRIEDIFGEEEFVLELDDETDDADVSPILTRDDSGEQDRPVAQDTAGDREPSSPQAEAPSGLDYSAWEDDDDGVDLDSQEAVQAEEEAGFDEEPVVAEDVFSFEDIEMDKADREKVAGFADQFYADDDDVLADMDRVSENDGQYLADNDDGGALSALTADRESQTDEAETADEGLDFLDDETLESAFELEPDTADDLPSRADDDFGPETELELPPELAARADEADVAEPEADDEPEQVTQSQSRRESDAAPANDPAPAMASRYTDFEDELAAELDVYQHEMDLADDDAALTDSFMGSGVPAESISIEADEDPAFAAAADDFVEAAVAAEEEPELDEAELDAQFAAWSPATAAPVRDRVVADAGEAEDDSDVSGFDFDLGPELEQALARSIDGDDGGDLADADDADTEPFEMPAGLAPFIASDDADAEDNDAEFDLTEFDDLWVEAPAAAPTSADEVELQLDASELDADEDETSDVDEEEAETEQVDRDEISSAFFDLLSDPADEPVIDTTPEADDHSDGEDNDEAELPAAAAWLGGMSTQASTVHVAEAGNFDTESASAGEGGFDPAALAEAEYGLEQIGEFDVPSIPHDDPVPAPDIDDGFEADIEREFAQLVDAETPDSYTVSETTMAGMSASAAAWPGVASASDEIIPDNYYDLEDNLESKPNGDFEDDDFTVRPSHQPVYADNAYQTEAPEQGDGRGGRGPVLALMVLGLAVVGGLGAFGWSMFSDGGTGSDAPRIIRADKEPIKVVPENPGGLVVPNQEKAVYEKVDGGDVSNPTQPNLVTSAEEPVDVVQRTLDPSFLPLEGESEAEPAKAEDRLAADEPQADAAPEAGSVVVVPRKVRTMVVRPDGTIVAREEPEPEPEANTAEAPVTGTPAGEFVAAAEPVAAATESAAVETTPAAAPETAAEAAGAAPVQVVKTQPITQPTVAAPVPQARPAEQPVNIVSTVTDKGNVNVPATPTQAATAPAVDNPGGYYMQIASQPTPEGAQASYTNLSKRFASVIANRGVQIQRADIPGKGVYHRVRIPAGTRDEANALCSRYKAAGGNCLVSR